MSGSKSPEQVTDTKQIVEFTEENLQQPWRAWVPQLQVEDTTKLAIAKDEQQSLQSKLITSKAEDGLCPGGPECGYEPHQLGFTKFCAIKTSEKDNSDSTKGWATENGWGFQETGTSG